MFNLFSSGPKKKKVLIIDDDQDMLDSYLKYFSLQKDYDVVGVNSKSLFMKEIDSADVVVSDFHMHTVTGITFERVLELCEEKKKPLLLLTGDIYPYFDFQLSKPINVKTLRGEVEMMMVRGFVASKRLPPSIKNRTKTNKAS